MFRFATVFEQTGVEPDEGYMTVPLKGSNLLLLRDAKAPSLQFDSSKLDVGLVTRNQLSSVSSAISGQFLQWGLVAEDSTKAYSAALYANVNSAFGSRLYFVTGKSQGVAPLYAVDGKSRLKLDVAILPPDIHTVAFRFLQCLDASGKMRAVTRWDTSDAQWLLNKLNWAYGPQANISFDLVDAAWARVPTQLNLPLTETGFRKDVASLRHPQADLTIFFVGKTYEGGKKSGQYFDDLSSAVLADDAAGMPVMKGSDPFLVSLAHEVAHFLGTDRTGQPTGHPPGNNNVLADGIQSGRLGRKLVALITGAKL